VATRTNPRLVLAASALRDLVDELGGYRAATRHLLRVAENVNKPIAVNVETGPDTSSTGATTRVSHPDERRNVRPSRG
jgi:hypothetical protein